MKVYKIRRKSDGLFSSGGIYPTWSETGKIWNAIGHLKNHLHLFKNCISDYNTETKKWNYEDKTSTFYDGCEIITYELLYSEADKEDVC